ncbi:MAG: TrmH family RNA methyltransferase [Betaproteobacteria bacterium]
MKRITSRQNPLVARFRAAARGEDDERLLLDGVHLVDEALSAGIRLREAIVRANALGQAGLAAIVSRLERAGVAPAAASDSVMDAASPVRSSSAIAALADRPQAGDDRIFGSAALVVVACDVQDPGNVGAIVRVAEAAGASGAIAAGRSADPFGWKALRGSMGSALRLPIGRRASVEDVVAVARDRGCRIVATVPRNGRSLFETDLTGPIAIAIGGEGAGLPPAVVEAAELCVSVPMQPPVESLNAAVTAALLLYEARRQRGLVAGVGR